MRSCSYVALAHCAAKARFTACCVKSLRPSNAMGSLHAGNGRSAAQVARFAPNAAAGINGPLGCRALAQISVQHQTFAVTFGRLAHRARRSYSALRYSTETASAIWLQRCWQAALQSHVPLHCVTGESAPCAPRCSPPSVHDATSSCLETRACCWTALRMTTTWSAPLLARHAACLAYLTPMSHSPVLCAAGAEYLNQS